MHGYHPFAEDAEIYLPGVEKILHPELFPTGQEFFRSHASLTLFPNLVAASLRVTHLPMEAGLFLWHVASIFLLLLACWELSGLLFSDANAKARWGGVCLVAALLTIPVAGTALYIMDQYLNPRNLAAFAGMFMVARTLEKKYHASGVVAGICGLHASADVGVSVFVLRVAAGDGKHSKAAGKMRARPDLRLAWLGSLWRPRTSRGLSRGGEATCAFITSSNGRGMNCWGLSRRWHCSGGLREWRAHQRQWPAVDRCQSRVHSLWTLIYLVAALVVDLPARFETLARLQPLRSLHLLYMLMFVLMGGFLGEYVLKNRVWRWLLLFVPLSAGDVYGTARALSGERAGGMAGRCAEEIRGRRRLSGFGRTRRWMQCSRSIPEYMQIAGEDEIGFRCLAQRSRLADAVQGQRCGEHVSAAGRGVVGAGAGADSVEEFPHRRFLAVERINTA